MCCSHCPSALPQPGQRREGHHVARCGPKKGHSLRRLKRKPPEEEGFYVRCMQNQALMELGAALE